MRQLVLDLGNQRWRARRPSYRDPAERIDTSAHEVVECKSDKLVKDFIAQHHYAVTCPPMKYRYTMHERGELVGVAAFTIPQHDAVTGNVFPELPREQRLELGRFVLLDRVAGNAESWFLGRAFALLRRAGVGGIVSFSDPVPRVDDTGAVVMPGHIGTIYQAMNARYRGRGRSSVLRVLRSGRVLSPRSLQKSRGAEVGWLSYASVLEEAGADAIDDDATKRQRHAWLKRWLGRLTTPVIHPGCHRYTWVISQRDRRTAQHYGPDRPYPKTRDELR